MVNHLFLVLTIQLEFLFPNFIFSNSTLTSTEAIITLYFGFSLVPTATRYTIIEKISDF